MRTFTCPHCANLLFFENSACVVCGTDVGYDRASASMLRTTGRDRCANTELAGCNWFAAGGPLCGCCELTRTRPADEDVDALDAFRAAEAAKRRLVYQLDDLGLPVTPRSVDPRHGLAFDLLSSTDQPVTTGHAGGVITIDLAEGDDGFREGLRARLAEPYRTLLGHFRHEIGHWYWDLLIADAPAAFRNLFGDERADYQQALAKHYGSAPGTGWAEDHVSHYAAAHPWEDWAETFAHLLHIRDTVQTAAALGVLVAGTPIAPHPGSRVDAVPEDRTDDVDELIATWIPLSRALNQLNRSMGKDDLYPFALSPAVQAKLRFAGAIVTANRTPARGQDPAASAR
ncbi:putative zinc-binding peptidase [Amycolatopsis sp. NBC_01307]|uniref:zinc-binding metallopeptidase family protein n=1 Tax=Amycolatopsis sp. NBC_01307 TaxID=2903561 RepID=UPI002E11BAF2|nr:putative zinc-binding peptidase [Amycolatopsis sp. NBC_01307]